MTTLLTPEQTAERLQVTPWFVRRELHAGRLRGSKVGNRWRVPETALDDYLTATSNVPESPTRRRRRRHAP